MEDQMSLHNYFAQSSIYKIALEKYLKNFGIFENFKSVFGGMYYIFLRGVSKNSGIYHLYPKEIDFDSDSALDF